MAVFRGWLPPDHYVLTRFQIGLMLLRWRPFCSERNKCCQYLKRNIIHHKALLTSANKVLLRSGSAVLMPLSSEGMLTTDTPEELAEIGELKPTIQSTIRKQIFYKYFVKLPTVVEVFP